MRRPWLAFAVVLFLAPSLNASARAPLTFEERVKAQEAIERVYYSHQLWPKENTAAKPPFEKVFTQAALEAKVADYLKKSQALNRFWHRPIEASQLQSEMDRMVGSTQDADTLRELFHSLNDDPNLIAECLARPVLANRLTHSWYVFDERYHGDKKNQASDALSRGNSSWQGNKEGVYRFFRVRLSDDNQHGSAQEFTAGTKTQSLPREEYDRWIKKVPPVGESQLQEVEEAFILVHTQSLGPDEWAGQTWSLNKRSFSSWWQEQQAQVEAINIETLGSVSFNKMLEFESPNGVCTGEEGWQQTAALSLVERWGHCAVWTGSRMVVWGGQIGSLYLNSGGIYDPALDTWVSTAVSDATPLGDYTVRAVWTGTEMLVWAGTPSGGRYNPQTDTWTAISLGANSPSARRDYSAVWTGTEMIVWGGFFSYYEYLNTGARYNPSSDSWSPTSIGEGAPAGRSGHTAVWTGTEMIVWGGYPLGDPAGGRYLPGTNSWVPMSTISSPQGRNSHTAVWTGSTMVIWGGDNGNFFNGDLNTGGIYDPLTDSWFETTTVPNCPTARYDHSAIWTGTEMIIWGGMAYGGPKYSGARFDPSSNSWMPISLDNVPSPRLGHTAVWTDSEMIVWGGGYYVNGELLELNSGGRYAPDSDSWVLTSQGNQPSARYSHTAVWTGTRMIVWGGDGNGSSYYTPLATGGQYDPAINAWSPTSESGDVPPACMNHTAVWTGNEMIVWGGYIGVSPWGIQTGGRYDPLGDTWTATLMDESTPAARYGHTAVWTGSKMVVWGGNFGSSYLNTGGQYDPLSDSWTPTSTGENCPEGRTWPSGVWSGSEMLIWGGNAAGFTSLNSGGKYNPSSDTWTPISAGVSAPEARSSHTSVWTGTRMIVWGGYSGDPLNSGGIYDPITDSWWPTSMGAYCPAARDGHSAVWTGQEMIVWGGGDQYGRSYSSGGQFDPVTNSWMPTSTNSSPLARGMHTMVWTGEKAILWGGNHIADTGGWTDLYQRLNDGAIYMPPPRPSAVPTCNLEDLDPCLAGVSISWAADPGDWGDSGVGVRGYYILRDGARVATGGCAGFLPYGTTSCTDDSTTPEYSYVYNIAYANGCKGIAATPDEVILDAGPSPVVDGADSGCSPPGVLLSTGSYTLYQWLLDGIEIPGATENTYSAVESGGYKVRVEDAIGCIAESAEKSVLVYPGPMPVVIGEHAGCYGVGTLLTTGNYLTYLWLKDGEPILGGNYQSYRATTSGSYAVQVLGDGGCQGTSPPFEVVIHPNPTPYVYGEYSGCADPGVKLSTDTFAAYQWQRNYADIVGATSQSYTVTQPGNYHYTVRVTDSNGCSATAMGRYVGIADNPVPTITGGDPQIYLLNADFNAVVPPPGWTIANGGGNCIWRLGYDTNNTGGSGYYAVANSDSCGSGTTMNTTMTTAAFSLNNPTYLSALLQFQTDFWDYDNQSHGYVDVTTDGTTWVNLLHFDRASSRGPRLVSLDLTPYLGNSTVKLRFVYTATNWNWWWQIDNVKVGITGPSGFCSTPGVPLSTGYFSSYQWVKDGADIPGATTGYFTATQSGDYTVRVASSSGCIGVSAVKALTIAPSPTPVVTGDASACPFPGAALSAGTFLGYQWIKDGVDIPGAASQGFTAVLSGSYAVRVTDATGCQGVSTAFPVTIFDAPAPQVSGPASGCAPSGVSLSTGAFATYQWALDGTPIPGATGQIFNATQSGIYTVATTASNGCSDTSQPYPVTIFAPAPIISGPVLACGSATLNTGSFASYQWYRNGTSIPGRTGNLCEASAPGTYTVRVVDTHGCLGSSPGFVVHAQPTPTVVTGGSACGSVALSTQSFSTYQWYMNGLAIAGAVSQGYTATASGMYSVAVSSAEGCSSLSADIGVTVHLPPSPQVAGAFVNSCPQISVLLTLPAGYTSYQWALNGTPLPGATAATLSAMVTGTYNAEVVDAFGCSGNSDFHPVFIDFCPDSEVSPWGATFPARLRKDSTSPTGYYLYFQRLDTVGGYNLYEGTLGAPYSHASAPGNACAATVEDLITGEMRAAITPSAGNHYYLVTAFGSGIEGPSGFDSQGLEIPKNQSTCVP